MKKTLLVVLVLCWISQLSVAQYTDRPVEHVFNRVWNGTNALNVSLSGTISLDNGAYVGAGKLSEDVTLVFIITSPDIIEPATNLALWSNNTGRDLHLQSMRCTSPVDEISFDIVKAPYTDYSSTTQIVHMDISTDGTSIFYNDLLTSVSFDNATIENGQDLLFNRSPGIADYIKIGLRGVLK